MKKVALTRPLELYVLLLLLLALGTGGVYGGLLLTEDPSGADIRMAEGVLKDDTFHSFLIPGIILLLFNGILPLLTAYALILQPEWRWARRLNIYPDRYWGWTFSLYCGIILAVWINVQLLLVEAFTVLQPAYGLYAVAVLIFTLMPRVMRYYQTPNTV